MSLNAFHELPMASVQNQTHVLRVVSESNLYNRTSFYNFHNLQCFNQRLLKGINVTGKLLHLTRFFEERKPIYLAWLEKMSIILESRPKKREILTQLRDEMVMKSFIYISVHTSFEFLLIKNRIYQPLENWTLKSEQDKTGT